MTDVRCIQLQRIKLLKHVNEQTLCEPIRQSALELCPRITGVGRSLLLMVRTLFVEVASAGAASAGGGSEKAVSFGNEPRVLQLRVELLAFPQCITFQNSTRDDELVRGNHSHIRHACACTRACVTFAAIQRVHAGMREASVYISRIEKGGRGTRIYRIRPSSSRAIARLHSRRS